MRFETLVPETPMWQAHADSSDWRALRSPEAVKMAFALYAVRRFEEAVLDLDKTGLVHGPAHSSIGQDGGAVGCMAGLPADSLITGSHRAHHQVLAKTLMARWPDAFDPTEAGALPEEMQNDVQGMLAEILGLRNGWMGGRGGSMHLRQDAVGVKGTNAIVAGGLPIACGLAWAEKVRASGRVVATFFGDGAVHQGTTHEAMNLAALYQLPVLFFLENNQYSVSMSISESTRETNLLTRPMAHGIPAVRVDGMDALAVREATRWAQERLTDGAEGEAGPVLIQADVYRYYHQSSPVVGSAFGYRTKAEEEAWRARDPVAGFHDRCRAYGLLDEAQLAAIDRLASAGVGDAVETLVEGKGSRRRIREKHWPDPGTIDAGIVGNLSELAGAAFAEPEEGDFGPTREMKLIEAMPAVMRRAMERDASIYVLGEDVANLGGGTVGATKGIKEVYPDRLVNTPICENGFCGMAAGMASNGLRPVVELMYSDFVHVAADQLLNQISKMRHLFGGDYPMPLVLRSRIPGPEGYGSQHSMDPAGLFMLYPGWRIVAPSNAFDYVGLMNSALRCNDPVLVLEHQSLHQRTTKVPEDLDYYIPLGRARRVAEGGQVTLLCTLAMVEEAVRVADEMGVAADIIDLRTVSLRDLDYALIGESLRKTNNVAIVEQSTRGTSIGAPIADEIQRRYFDHLDQPVQRVVGAWAPPPVSKVLEGAALAGAETIRTVLSDMLANTSQRPARAPGLPKAS